MGLDHVVSKSSTCASSSDDSERRSCSFNAPAISIAAAELLLTRMLAKIDGLCAERV